MKKIGIITFHESDNYGTVLQAYALQELLLNNGFSAEIVNFRRPSIVNASSNNLPIFRRIFSVINAYGIKNLTKRKIIKKLQQNKKERFDQFRKDRFKYTNQEFGSFNELETIENEYDAFIVGSDMVWSSDRSQNLNVYFLRFTSKKKRIAFSPSFGSTIIADERKEEYIEGIKGFKSLSCREESGINLIRELTGREATLTADPTISCNGDVWKGFNPIQNLPEKYILVYMFEGMPDWLLSRIDEISKKNQTEIIEIPTEIKSWCRSLKNRIIYSAIGPEEFVQLFRHASCIITNSYHGLMFSLIFSKPFIVIQRSNHRWGQFEDRLTDMLRRMRCEERLLTQGDDIKEDLLFNSSINFDKHLNDLRKESIDYLNCALSEIEFVSEIEENE